MAGSPIPELPPENDPTAQVWRDVDGVAVAYGHTVNGNHWMHLPGLASFCFADGLEEVKAIVHRPAAEREWIEDAYLRCVLPHVLQAQGTEVLHASAVLTPRGVAAFCAQSGTGKSTITAGLSRRRYPLWADDAVALALSAEKVTAIPLPCSLRLLPDAIEHLNQLYPSRPPAHLKHQPSVPAALFVLERISTSDKVEDSTAERLSPAKAFTELLPHAYCFSLAQPDRKERMIRHYLELSARVPVFKLRFHHSFDRFDELLDRIEEMMQLTPPRKP